MPAPGPSSMGARYTSSSSTSPACRNEAFSLCPASRCSSFTPRRARSLSTAAKSTLGRLASGQLTTVTPWSVRAAMPAPKGRAVYTSTSPGGCTMRAPGGSSSRESITTRSGWRAVSTRRTSSRGLSASTVPMPVSSAPARLRQAWPSARAAGPVIHWLTPLCRAVAPSSEAATFMRTQGRPRSMRLKKPIFSSRVAWASGWVAGSTSTTTPAARSRATPWPLTSGLGSVCATTTRATPAAISASQHGGVRPWWLHGSSVTSAVAP